jgi:hypothetical protein
MKKIGLGSLLFLFAFFLPSGVLAVDFLAEADTLYAKGGIENCRESIDLYLKALEANPASYETNWKCARAYRTYGDKVKRRKREGWKKTCAEYGKKGMHYGQQAIDLEPREPEGYYYYGLNVGIYADGVSVLTAFRQGLKKKTQRSFEKAYEMDKMYDKAGPVLALGRFYSVLPWPYKDKKKALRYYREYQATKHFAHNIEAHIYLAELLLQIRGKEHKTEAKALLEKAAESNEVYYREWARRLLEEMK